MFCHGVHNPTQGDDGPKQELAARRMAQEQKAHVQLEAFAGDITGAAELTRMVQSGPAAKTILRHARAQHCRWR